jgi:DNA topoisomerase-3
MGKQLVIAEKPSVAADIARALGGFSKNKDYFESADFVVSSAVGHLLELAAPEKFEAKRGKWKLAALPVIPEYFDLKPIEKSAPRLNLLAKLYRRRDIDGVINACDAGREGELIFHHVVKHIGGAKAKPARRLWLQSMTAAAIREGFADLRAADEFRPLRSAAVCREESDWLVGINATRALTALNSRDGGFALTTVGRVQTPTLAILVERENQIRAFIPRDYWEVRGDFALAAGDFAARWINPAHKSGGDEHARPERIWEQEKAAAIVAKCQGKNGEMSEEKKPQSLAAPPLFDLTSLQRDANARFGLPAKATLAAAQALYERHKLLTYPRTDSRFLPEDYPPLVKKALAKIGEFGGALAPFAKQAHEMVRPGNRRIFDNAKVSDHFAIIPTGVAPPPGLREIERKIFDNVARRFVAVFFPPAKFEITVRRVVIEGETFEAKGKVVKDPGWMAAAGRAESADKELVAAAANEKTARNKALEAEQKQTRPPPRYSEATLLSAMEGAGKFVDDEALREAMKDKGLGTPATRAAMIEKLIRENYIVRDARELRPTPRAHALLKLLQAMATQELTAPALTGEWERKLKQIERAGGGADEFMNEIREMTRKIVSAAKSVNPDAPLAADGGDKAALSLAAKCPACGGAMRETIQKFACDSCDFFLWKSRAGREFSRAEIEQLLSEGRTEVLEGFRSRLGREFAARAVLDSERRLAFEFENATADDGDDDLTPGEAIAKCPRCGAQVFARPRRYACENNRGSGADNKQEDAASACDFSFARFILKREISPAEFGALLADGKTPLLRGFTSKRGRPFDAFLKINLADKDAKLEFEFPPRKSPPAKKGAAKKKR